MAKFKVGDRVKTVRQPNCVRLEKGQELTITRITDYIGRLRGQLYEFDDTGNGVYETEIELVAPPLFRKGDKVMVEYTVECDEDKSINAQRGSGLPVSAPGLRTCVYRSVDMLRAGTITRAPEPPYVPKVGDKFSFLLSSGEPSMHINTLVFADAKGILYEDRHGHRYTSGINYEFFKR